MGYRICVIGLGLMGASLCGALRGFRGARIVGMDVLGDVRERAERSGLVDFAATNAGDAIEGSDLVVFCVYAHNIPEMIGEHARRFRRGAVVSDICGVKGALYARLEGLLPDDVDYVGIHPMAGRERDGFDNADPAIYENSGMIITPLPRSKPEGVSLMREMAEHIGASRIAVTPPEEHDAIIAYTSDLMHIASAGLCMDFHPGMTPAHAAGAFRDCTRVADINAGAWTELLMSNRRHVLERLDIYMNNLSRVREALASGDERELFSLLDAAGGNKREMLAR
ncbi:MAG: prephenate dehydrogenase [Synergistaceae bacterium]|jgi:prephenate dehydrogenase|nr:prephenate dehydrogenase [Synergistaceae bacterium]